MITDPYVAVKAIVAYQRWAEEKFMSADRAEDVLSGLCELLSQPRKADKVQWLITQRWCDTKAGAARLVDALAKVVP